MFVVRLAISLGSNKTTFPPSAVHRADGGENRLGEARTDSPGLSYIVIHSTAHHRQKKLQSKRRNLTQISYSSPPPAKSNHS